MNVLKKVLIIWASVIFVASLAACNKPDPAEIVGKKIDEIAENAGNKIDEAATKLDEQSEKMREPINDAAITTNVKGAILAEPDLSVLQIRVNTKDGEVTLSGSIDSQHDIDKAQAIASSVAGVRKVKNQLVLVTTK